MQKIINKNKHLTGTMFNFKPNLIIFPCIILICTIGLLHSNNNSYPTLKIDNKKQVFKIKKVNTNFFYETTKITYYYDTQKVGFIYTEKLPFSFYIIHTFYIMKNKRNQGHGSCLLQYTCEKLKNDFASKIIIQPGPFELGESALLTISEKEYTKNLMSLCAMYKKNGFNFAPQTLSFLAKLLYKLLGIKENSNFLMWL